MNGAITRFLLIEDDDDHAEFLIRALKRARSTNEVERMSDGAQALTYLRGEGEHAGRPTPDVILLDLKLPKVSGHEVLAGIKSDPVLLTIPVVVLTTSDAESDRARAYASHANSYLVKPIDFEQFRQLIHDLEAYWGICNRPAADAP